MNVDTLIETAARQRTRGSHGWLHLDRQRKRELIEAIATGKATRGPLHAELNITDRCNVACYFCSQQDLRTKEQICFERVVQILDELVANGLRSVRFAGGGDPLFHPDIVRILDHLGSRGIVVDNITSNGVGLTAVVAERLVRDGCREVIISLNAVDAADYKRMMAVKPDRFDRVLANTKHLLQLRGDKPSPAVVVQFLLDRQNYHRLVEMYRVGRAIGADVIVIGLVLEIPLERIERGLLLAPQDAELLRPHLVQVLQADRDASLLQLNFPIPSWNSMVLEIRAQLQIPDSHGVATASSFHEENGACFFAWYSTVIRGNGDLHPCCLMQTPELTPVGNVRSGSFAEQWNGPAYTRMRDEMREVFLTRGQVAYNRARFKQLEPYCVEAHKCYLKNMYFRADEEFYRELGEALEPQREREVRWVGTPSQMLRAAEVYIYRHPWARSLFERLRVGSRPLRHWFRRQLGNGRQQRAGAASKN